MKQFSQGMEQERGSMIRENKFELDFIWAKAYFNKKGIVFISKNKFMSLNF